MRNQLEGKRKQGKRAETGVFREKGEKRGEEYMQGDGQRKKPGYGNKTQCNRRPEGDHSDKK
jgi:hypothetical protein